MKLPLLLALVGTSCAVSWAQPDVGAKNAPPTVPNNLDGRNVAVPNNLDGRNVAPPVPGKQTFRVILKNVRPSLMAYWLDPTNHTPPPEMGAPTGFAPLANMGTPATPRGIIQLPAGVDKIVAIDPQNALILLGTEQGNADLAKRIAVLDKPLRQVEVGTQFVVLPNNDAEKLVPQNKDQFPTASLKKVDAAFNTTLEALIQQGQATTLSTPRVLAINNLTAQINTSTAQSVQLQGTNGAPRLPHLPEGLTLYLETRQALQVTPTINTDETITLLVRSGRDLQLKTSTQEDNGLRLNKDQAQVAIVSLREGETIALLQNQTPEQTENSQRTLLLLTVRQVKNATR